MMRPLSLRTRLFLIVLIGAVLPLAIVGVWLARSAARSGEALLRQRLEESLRRVVADVGGRWVPERSELITLADQPAVQAALRSTADASVRVDDDLRSSYTRLEKTVESVIARTNEDRRLTLFASHSGASTNDQTVTAMIDVYDRVGGQRIGALEARVRIATLVPVSTAFSAAAGTILQVIDRSTGTPLLPVPFEASLALQDEFTWQGERWLSVGASIEEPPIDLAVSAPLTSFAQPFEAAARRGLAGLAAVLGCVLIVTTLLTRQTTKSLRSLAGAAEAIAHGEYNHTVPVCQDDDIGRVAAAFNVMSGSLRRTLDELAERQSFAAVGEFATSLAHEVRNPLTSIRLDLQRLEEKLSGEPPLADAVRRALRSVVRLDATVTGALRVARSGRLTLEQVDIREPIDTAIKDVEMECRARSIELTRNRNAAGTIVSGDQSALHQLFLNLLLNAAQAIDRAGTIDVSIVSTADTVSVKVSDSGVGIAPELRDRIFDPLFSTKTQGSGLGLAIAQRIVAGHGGELSLESEPGHGTVVHVTFPLARTS
jgi:signal transduction histidine kinase